MDIFSQQYLLELIISLTYSPVQVYVSIICILVISSFGLPLPEEVVIFVIGFACFMGMNPDVYPPPYLGALPLNVYVSALVCWIAVVISDSIVFIMGRFFGERFLKRHLKKYENKFNIASGWTQNYGCWAVGFFRFTPGLRFPGHFSFGMMGFSYFKFAMIDGLSALISVPTQIFLIAYYGEDILIGYNKFKTIIISLVAIFIVGIITIKLISAIRKRNRQNPST